MSTESITVPIDALARPNLPLILADSAFLTELARIEAQVEKINLTDAASAQASANLLKTLTTTGVQLEDTRTALKAPYLDICTRIDALAKAPKARIEAAKAKIKVAQTNYALAVQKAAQEAETARKAELARLEAEKAKQAPPPPTDPDDWGDAPAPTPVEKAIAQVKATPAVVAPKIEGIRMVVSLLPTVTDVNKLPDAFVEKTAKIKALVATYCQGWSEAKPLPVVPGVRFDVMRTTQSTGR